MESILTSIKKLLGIPEDHDHFDPDIIIHINTTLMVLTQLGIGPSEGFFIEDDSATWDDFLSDNQTFEAVKSYVHLKVKLLFDPPLSSTVIESYNRIISELEWRLSAMVDQAKIKSEEAIQNG